MNNWRGRIEQDNVLDQVLNPERGGTRIAYGDQEKETSIQVIRWLTTLAGGQFVNFLTELTPE